MELAPYDEDVEEASGLSLEARAVARAFAGTWKTVWVITIESLTKFLEERGEPLAFRRHLLHHIQGQEVEFVVDELGRWIEREVNNEIFFWGDEHRASEPCEVNGAPVTCRSPGGVQELKRRVEFSKDAILRIIEEDP